MIARVKVLIILLLLTKSLFLQAQHEEISSSLKEYFTLLEKKEVSDALDHIHPELINMLGKSTFEEQYNQLFNTPGVEIGMSDFSVDTLSQIYVYEKEKYALVDYSFKMTFKVDISHDESGLLSDVLLSSYQSRFGKNNVTSETPGTYLIHTERELFAVKSQAFEGWKIADFEEGMRIMIVAFIPEAVLNHFNR